MIIATKDLILAQIFSEFQKVLVKTASKQITMQWCHLTFNYQPCSDWKYAQGAFILRNYTSFHRHIPIHTYTHYY